VHSWHKELHKLRGMDWSTPGHPRLLLALVGLLLVLRGRRSTLGWGFQFQSPIFLLVLAGFVFSRALVAAIEIGRYADQCRRLSCRETRYAALFHGSPRRHRRTPCTAPLWERRSLRARPTAAVTSRSSPHLLSAGRTLCRAHDPSCVDTHPAKTGGGWTSSSRRFRFPSSDRHLATWVVAEPMAKLTAGVALHFLLLLAGWFLGAAGPALGDPRRRAAFDHGACCLHHRPRELPRRRALYRHDFRPKPHGTQCCRLADLVGRRRPARRSRRATVLWTLPPVGAELPGQTNASPLQAKRRKFLRDGDFGVQSALKPTHILDQTHAHFGLAEATRSLTLQLRHQLAVKSTKTVPGASAAGRRRPPGLPGGSTVCRGVFGRKSCRKAPAPRASSLGAVMQATSAVIKSSAATRVAQRRAGQRPGTIRRWRAAEKWRATPAVSWRHRLRDHPGEPDDGAEDGNRNRLLENVHPRARLGQMRVHAGWIVSAT